MITARVLDPNLPLLTAMRAAIEEGQILQCNENVSVLAPKLLPGFTRIVGGGMVGRNVKEGMK